MRYAHAFVLPFCLHCCCCCCCCCFCCCCCRLPLQGPFRCLQPLPPLLLLLLLLLLRLQLLLLLLRWWERSSQMVKSTAIMTNTTTFVANGHIILLFCLKKWKFATACHSSKMTRPCQKDGEWWCSLRSKCIVVRVAKRC